MEPTKAVLHLMAIARTYLSSHNRKLIHSDAIWSDQHNCNGEKRPEQLFWRNTTGQNVVRLGINDLGWRCQSSVPSKHTYSY
ncbi:hypothetical protein WDU94_014453 [Cyamophila willieti]